MSRVILVGCVGKKIDTPDGQVPAEELYNSPLFAKRRAYATREVGVGSAVGWGILSALHGCIRPDLPIETYDWTMADWTVTELGGWGQKLPMQLWCAVLEEEYPLRGLVVEIHAGYDYVETAKPYLEGRGCMVTQPLKHLGIGEQLAWYNRELAVVA